MYSNNTNYMTKIVTIVLAILVLGGGLFYFVTRSGDTTTPTDKVEQSDADVTQAESAVPSGKGSLKSLFTLGENLKCTFRYADPETGYTTEGTTYITDKRMRGDFITTQQGVVYNTKTIMDGDVVYTWGDSPQGEMAMKFTIDESNTSNDDNNPLERDDQVEYECSRWSVDSSRFVPPSDVEFQDLSAIMQQLNSSTNTVQSAQCSACDQAPAEAREQCRAALGC